jgi:peptide-methionine (S)-S-oxide reductase
MKYSCSGVRFFSSIILTLSMLMGNLPAAEPSAKTEKIVLGAGCFWCMELIFENIPGVVSVVSGYAGGSKKNPTYAEVGSGGTGHAEVVQIEFDPTQVTYETLLKTFWNSHDATVKNGVAPDFGTQYRSIILYQNAAEKTAAEKSRDDLQKKLGAKVTTEIVPLTIFYPAEIYHQDYVKNHPNNPYVLGVSKPRFKETQAKDLSMGRP